MKLHFFAIPAREPEQAAAELQRFLDQHRVVALDKELVQDGAQSFWSVCVTTTQADPRVEGKPRRRTRVDYKEVLSPGDFAVFARLREVRKGLAKAEGVPAYAVFTNEQLAKMVTEGVDSLAKVEALSGVGPARAGKYGEAMLQVLIEAREADATS